MLLLLLFILPSAIIVVGRSTIAVQDDTYRVSQDSTPFLRGPTVNLVTNDSATLFWRTQFPTNASVLYGLNQSLLENVHNLTIDTDHYIRLSSLDADSTYWYKVISNGTESEVYHFRTAPLSPESVKIIVIGDNRPSSEDYPPSQFSTLVDMIIAEQPHFVLMTGDYVYHVYSSASQNKLIWDAFTNITDRLGHYVPIYAVVGNHDVTVVDGKRVIKYFLDAFVLYDEPRTYSSFDYAGMHFALLDTEELNYAGRIAGEQYQWLVNDLTASHAKYKFVVAHRPLYPIKHIGSALDVNKTERTMLQQLFEDTNVTAFIAGHDHAYDRLTVNGVVNIISGGGGAPLYQSSWGVATYHYLVINVTSTQIDFRPINLNGIVFSPYSLPYSGPIEISLRVMANGSTKAAGSVPEVYFSETPVEYYFSWDGTANVTELPGLPPNGMHELEVFAKNTNDVWSYARYVFYAPVTTTTTTGTVLPTIGTYPISPAMMMGLIGAFAAVIVVVVWFKTKH